MKNLAIFGSGSGSNAENICLYFKHSKIARVSLICSNKVEAYIAKRAERLGVEFISFEKKIFESGLEVIAVLKKHSIDYIILAGFLLKVPKNIISLYSQKIINIHPSLLPKYGGKGMYGDNVHQEVLLNQESRSGITIHFVDDKYDQGKIIFQKSITVNSSDDINSLKKKVSELERLYFPKTIEKLILKECQ